MATPSRLASLARGKSLNLDIPKRESSEQDSIGSQIRRDLSIWQVSETLFIGICSEDVRKNFISNPPEKMFDFVGCLSLLNRNHLGRPDLDTYQMVGDQPGFSLEKITPDITLRYNTKALGDNSGCSDQFEEQLPELLSILDEYMEESKKNKRVLVLINCLVGAKRSCAVAMALLVKTKGVSVDESLAMIRARRSFVSPPRGFVEVLKRYFGK